MLGWIKWLWQQVSKKASRAPAPKPVDRHGPGYVPIREYAGSGDPPPMHWKACHPSTVRRFKAEMTCGSGHGLVLKGHSVGADGHVSPSVVCMKQGCSFHEFVHLVGWSAGPLD